MQDLTKEVHVGRGDPDIAGTIAPPPRILGLDTRKLSAGVYGILEHVGSPFAGGGATPTFSDMLVLFWIVTEDRAKVDEVVWHHKETLMPVVMEWADKIEIDDVPKFSSDLEAYFKSQGPKNIRLGKEAGG